MFRVNLDALRASHESFLAEHKAMVAGVLYDTGGLVIAETILRPGFTPRTGKTQKATQTRVVRASNGSILRITNDKPVATYLEKGTRPHVIAAKNAKALRFLSGGAWVFRRRVNHPGTKPYWTFRNATSVGASKARRLLESGMSRIAARRF